MQNIHWTLLYAALIALLQCGMVVLIIMRRATAKIDFLDGGDRTMLLRMRAHGNLIETAPITLLLLAFLEMRGLSVMWVQIFGGVFVLSRILHIRGLLANNETWSRRAGTSLTLTVLIVQAVCAIKLWAQ